MNKHLYDWYHSLSEEEQREVAQQFADSPVTGRILTFLEQCAPNFRTEEAVEFLYPEKESTVNYHTRRNRYFKLRKKLLETSGSGLSVTDQLLTTEENAYFQCRRLQRLKNIETAYQQLVKLEEHCWKLNIFELLPSILHDIVFCLHSLQKFDQTTEVFERLDEATQLQQAVRDVQILGSKIYETVLRDGYPKALPLYKRMKAISKQHKAYPRFKMMYHLFNVAYASDHNAQDIKELLKHNKTLKALRKEHPEMPVESFRPNCVANTSAYVKGREMALQYIKGDAREAMAAMHSYWELLEQHPDALRIGLRDFTNRIFLEMLNGQSDAAWETTERLAQFIKRNIPGQSQHIVHKCKAEIFVMDFDKRSCRNPRYYLNRLEEMEQLESSSNPSLAGEAAFFRGCMAIVHGFKNQAGEAFASEGCNRFLEENDLGIAFEQFSKGLHQPKGLPDAIAHLKTAKREAGTNLKQAYFLNWFLRFLQHKA